MMKSLYKFIQLIFARRHLVIAMAQREIATQYVGSLLGFIWTFINPLILILVFWFVFSIGFRVRPQNEVPFVVWLTAGMAAWFVFADIVRGSAGVVVANSHLIKKTLFPSQILPVVKLVSCLIIHSVFLSVLIGLILFQKMPFSIYYFQFLYYLFCLSVFSLGLSWAFSALNVFIRDVNQVVGVLIQVGFWATPVFWDINIMPPKVHMVLKLNPLFYIVQGYRDSFIDFIPFWNHPYLTLYFCLVTAIVFCLGAFIFWKLKPQFADVL